MNKGLKLSLTKEYAMAENFPPPILIIMIKAKINLALTKWQALNKEFYIHYLILSSQQYFEGAYSLVGEVDNNQIIS